MKSYNRIWYKQALHIGANTVGIYHANLHAWIADDTIYLRYPLDPDVSSPITNEQAKRLQRVHHIKLCLIPVNAFYMAKTDDKGRVSLECIVPQWSYIKLPGLTLCPECDKRVHLNTMHALLRGELVP